MPGCQPRETKTRRFGNIAKTYPVLSGSSDRRNQTPGAEKPQVLTHLQLEVLTFIGTDGWRRSVEKERLLYVAASTHSVSKFEGENECWTGAFEHSRGNGLTFNFKLYATCRHFPAQGFLSFRPAVAISFRKSDFYETAT